jgi:glycerol kinase
MAVPAALLCEELVQGGYDDLIQQKRVKDRYLLFSLEIALVTDHNPEISTQTGKALIGTIDTYLIHRLTG